jgi:hypothetical protein
LGCMVFAWLKIQNMFISSQGEMDILNAVPFFKTHYIVFFKYVYIYIYVVHFPNRGTTLAKFTTKDHWFGHALRSCNRKSMHTTGRCFFLDVICSMNVIYEYLTKRVQNCESK